MSQQKIDKIAVQNFKFFAKEQVISIEGKHLLLYGENGSGKSSIYWSLYTLLEAANKDDVKEIKKYFDIEDDERLLNINLIQNTNDTPESFVKVDFIDNSNSYEVSLTKTDINKNSFAKESNLSSDFINYRHLLSLYNFAHSDEIDLFGFFRYAILPYDKFKPINIYKRGKSIDSQSASEIINYLISGPPKIEEENGVVIYPTKSSNKVYHDNFQKTVEQSVNELKELITYINTQGNPILQSDLEYNITFNLSVVNSKDHKISKNDYAAPEIKILLTLPEYEGKKNQVNRPHSFLNEAKLTAVALAIRLAVLKRTLSKGNTNSLKLLVFDDLMISLDMSNRERILKLILNKYVNQYQVFILTHDRSLFYDTLMHLKQFYEELALKEGITEKDEIEDFVNTKWNFLEMYQATHSAGYKLPFITKHQSNIQRAYYYFKEQIDYKACANNLRSAFEEHFINFLPEKKLKDPKGNPTKSTSLLLGSLLSIANDYFDEIGYEKRPLRELARFITRSLNPQSHYNPKTNFYRKELEDVFSIYRDLNNITNKPLIELNEYLKFDIQTVNDIKYTYTIQLLDYIRIYNKNNGDNPDILETDKRSYGLISLAENGVITIKMSSGTVVNKKTLLELYKYTCEQIKNKAKKNPIIETNVREIFYNDKGQSIQNLINNYSE
ncbi:hypothetical protein [Polaribacter aestuariivivens]|uniref:hypothetical protein n=1 Tax=Polaribacter aestuariivivens TaxID=2304626 RepID=UPI003F496859